MIAMLKKKQDEPEKSDVLDRLLKYGLDNDSRRFNFTTFVSGMSSQRYLIY